MGKGPYVSSKINPRRGDPQADISREYKKTIILETAGVRAVSQAEREEIEGKLPTSDTKAGRRNILARRIDELTEKYKASMHIKTTGMRYKNFNVYFSVLLDRDGKGLGWVEFTGEEEPSEFQDKYPPGQPRRYYRITAKGRAASEEDWEHPFIVQYPQWAAGGGKLTTTTKTTPTTKPAKQPAKRKTAPRKTPIKH